MLSSLPIGASAFVDGDDAIKVGVIGCGGRGTGAAVQALSTKQNVKLVAMADAFRDRLDQSHDAIKGELENNEVDTAGLSVPDDQKFVGFDAYQKVIPLVDVVILTTPPGFRPMHFERAPTRWQSHHRDDGALERQLRSALPRPPRRSAVSSAAPIFPPVSASGLAVPA